LAKADPGVNVIRRRHNGVHRLGLIREVALVNAEQVGKIRRQAQPGDGFEIGEAKGRGEEGSAAVRFMEQGHASPRRQFNGCFEQSPVVVKGEDVAPGVAGDEKRLTERLSAKKPTDMLLLLGQRAMLL
jgi:hypothetical protein